MKATSPKNPLVLVSNRLSLSLSHENGRLKSQRSSGGLVTALEPLLKQHGGAWVGSAVATEDHEKEEIRRALREEAGADGFSYEPVFLSKEEQENFYEGFSNEIIWPLFHDLQTRCNFEPRYWDFYQTVNEKFAEAILRVAPREEPIWINDYQLLQVAAALRRRGSHARLAFFLHIPFPPPDIYAKLPWRREILEGLLQHDLIGFQTARDERNFIACLRAFVPDLHLVGAGRHHARMISYAGREIKVHAFPISIDFKEFSEHAASADVEERLADIRAHNQTSIILGVDRLDYTKGILERFRAFSGFLHRFPEWRGKASLIQIAVPSRENIPVYQTLRTEIEKMAASINGEFAAPSWVPINYIHRSVSRAELLALYRAAAIALITPLKDGMNLVAKEYCACRIHGDGVLVLSEFAGAAPELGAEALLVNPYDQAGIAIAVEQALNMPQEEQRHRMKRLRAQVRRYDIHHWLDSFLAELESIGQTSTRAA